MKLNHLLETFLGGMETYEGFWNGYYSFTLKPSLVEWKHVGAPMVCTGIPPLETFLGGMETSESV